MFRYFFLYLSIGAHQTSPGAPSSLLSSSGNSILERKHISNFINPLRKALLMGFARSDSALLMDPCMLDDGLDPPRMDTSPVPSAKLGPMGAKQEQSPSLFSSQDTKAFAASSWVPTTESPKCGNYLCEWTRLAHFQTDYTATNLKCLQGHVGLELHFIEPNLLRNNTCI